ncbi:hypothetical protein RCL_jg23758.t1 [Rhizophagus clarus]|uniref:Uncharacterized protein n=1 Tax=Rhizophagus clarus TaxID=94130 RepID=A0A8H3QRY7_9GLOM|nr:hypothetical protein RCL_jg23758.t1 [Rhizophagus clarus]
MSNKNIREFLEGVANICLNLRRLSISSLDKSIHMGIKEHICTIIRKQNKLTALQLRLGSSLNGIHLSLESQNIL